MAAVVGDIKDDSFVKLIRKETEEFLDSLELLAGTGII